MRFTLGAHQAFKLRPLNHAEDTSTRSEKLANQHIQRSNKINELILTQGARVPIDLVHTINRYINDHQNHIGEKEFTDGLVDELNNKKMLTVGQSAYKFHDRHLAKLQVYIEQKFGKEIPILPSQLNQESSSTSFGHLYPEAYARFTCIHRALQQASRTRKDEAKDHIYYTQASKKDQPCIAVKHKIAKLVAPASNRIQLTALKMRNLSTTHIAKSIEDRILNRLTQTDISRHDRDIGVAMAQLDKAGQNILSKYGDNLDGISEYEQSALSNIEGMKERLKFMPQNNGMTNFEANNYELIKEISQTPSLNPAQNQPLNIIDGIILGSDKKISHAKELLNNKVRPALLSIKIGLTTKLYPSKPSLGQDYSVLKGKLPPLPTDDDSDVSNSDIFDLNSSPQSIASGVSYNPPSDHEGIVSSNSNQPVVGLHPSAAYHDDKDLHPPPTLPPSLTSRIDEEFDRESIRGSAYDNDIFNVFRTSDSTTRSSQSSSNHEALEPKLKPSSERKIISLFKSRQRASRERNGILKISLEKPGSDANEYSVQLPITSSENSIKKEKQQQFDLLFHNLISAVAQKYPQFSGIQIKKDELFVVNTNATHSGRTYQHSFANASRIAQAASKIRQALTHLFTETDPSAAIYIVNASYPDSSSEQGLGPSDLSSLPCFTNPSNCIQVLSTHEALLRTQSASAAQSSTVSSQ